MDYLIAAWFVGTTLAFGFHLIRWAVTGRRKNVGTWATLYIIFVIVPGFGLFAVSLVS